jgi:O-methyltransferase
MSENPHFAIRLLRRFAGLIGLENAARRLYHRWTRPHRGEGIESLRRIDAAAHEIGAYTQWLMDIDPRSPWHSREFVARFGGFHPPDGPRTLVREGLGDRVRNDFLLLLLREIVTRKIPGELAEIGVHRGDSARVLHHFCPERKLFLFDTFTGFTSDDLARESLRVGYNETTQFTDTSVDLAIRKIAPQGNTVVPVVGWFPQSIPAQLHAETFAFVHIDVDLEAPATAGLEFFWPRLAPGGYIVLHDYNAWPGLRLAVDQFCTRHRLVVVPMPDKSGSVVLPKPLPAITLP